MPEVTAMDTDAGLMTTRPTLSRARARRLVDAAAREAEATTVIDVVRRLFNLREKDKETGASDAGKNKEVGTRH